MPSMGLGTHNPETESHALTTEPAGYPSIEVFFILLREAFDHIFSPKSLTLFILIQTLNRLGDQFSRILQIINWVEGTQSLLNGKKNYKM